ncbi:hypothetical protein EBR25_01510 [bacterium]|jgi:predicted MPP superfamily phosphohydrolase|nr:hypothetical protein [bacterium]
MKRRDFLKLGLFSGATGLGLLSVANSPSKATPYISSSSGFTTGILEITEVSIPLPEHLERFDNLQLAFITDIHHGAAMDPKWLTTIKEVVNARKVDIILLGGDYIWAPDSALIQAITPRRNSLFRELKGEELVASIYTDLFQTLAEFQSRYGIFGVRGNHDCWHSPQQASLLFHKYTGELLVNQRSDIMLDGMGTIELAGADDYWIGMPQPPKFSDNKNSLKIFLTHNPDHLVEECEGTIPKDALVLCGHTHGGQVSLPTLGVLTYNIRSKEYGYGLNIVDNFTVFTSRGIGVVELPFRYNCPQEVVFIKFVANGSKHVVRALEI